MPATPAWPPRTLTRLFVDQPLGVGVAVSVEGPQANYLGNVMRMKAGDQ
ncbi:MAG: 16S rRNA (uracil(1498)-N(3))-methyltransferase, partial [Pseudomonadota bacterium]|nr:16S rRNA (uracil(1498)-N(3))-methyltransferase [Pseudomonadota bacterium]